MHSAAKFNNFPNFVLRHFLFINELCAFRKNAPKSKHFLPKKIISVLTWFIKIEINLMIN